MPDKDEVAAVCNWHAASGGLVTRTVVVQDGPHPPSEWAAVAAS